MYAQAETDSEHLPLQSETRQGGRDGETPRGPLACAAQGGSGDRRRGPRLSGPAQRQARRQARSRADLRGVHGVEEPEVARAGTPDARRYGGLGTDGRHLRGDGLPRLRGDPLLEAEGMSDKPSPPPKTERELADQKAVFAALAHPSRRHILLVMHFRGGEMTAGEIADRFACSWPTTTRHLRILESAKLVRVERRGRERVYHLDSSRLLGITTRWLNAFSRKPSTVSKG